MLGKNIGYIRVSTLIQNTERQLYGISLDKVFEDKLSGKDTNRPQLQACLEQLCSLLVIAEEKRKVRPVVIFLKSLPEILTEEVKDILRFAESVRTLFTQVIMFSPTLCDYFYDNIKNIAVLGYYEDANEERIMKVQFVERV